MNMSSIGCTQTVAIASNVATLDGDLPPKDERSAKQLIEIMEYLFDLYKQTKRLMNLQDEILCRQEFEMKVDAWRSSENAATDNFGAANTDAIAKCVAAGVGMLAAGIGGKVISFEASVPFSSMLGQLGEGPASLVSSDERRKAEMSRLTSDFIHDSAQLLGRSHSNVDNETMAMQQDSRQFYGRFAEATALLFSASIGAK